MKPKVIFIGQQDGRVNMTMQELQELLDDHYEAGRNENERKRVADWKMRKEDRDRIAFEPTHATCSNCKYRVGVEGSITALVSTCPHCECYMDKVSYGDGRWESF